MHWVNILSFFFFFFPFFFFYNFHFVQTFNFIHSSKVVPSSQSSHFCEIQNFLKFYIPILLCTLLNFLLYLFLNSSISLCSTFYLPLTLHFLSYFPYNFFYYFLSTLFTIHSKLYPPKKKLLLSLFLWFCLDYTEINNHTYFPRKVLLKLKDTGPKINNSCKIRPVGRTRLG